MSRDETPPPGAVSGRIAASISFGASATLDAKSAFSFPYLMGATKAALRLREIEADKNWDRDGDEAIQQGCIAIVLAATALEAYSNELLSHCLDKPQDFTAEVNEDFRQLFGQKNAILKDKFTTLSRAVGCSYNFGAEPWQNTGHVQTLRNALVHFRPSWASRVEYKQDQKSLAAAEKVGKAWFNHGELQFPRGTLHYRSARFCVLTVATFMDDFAHQTGLPKGPAQLNINAQLPE